MASVGDRIKQMRWWHWLLAVLGVLALSIAILELLWWPFLRTPIERRLGDALERQVTVGPGFGVRLIGSIRLRGDSLVIGPAPDGPTLKDEQGQSRNFLEAGHFTLALPYSTVRALMNPERGEAPRVRSLEVERLRLGLVRQADGKANWSFGGPKEPDAPQREYPVFDRLVLRDGALLLEDAVIDLKLDAKASTREGLRAQANAGGSGEGATQASEGLEIQATGSYRESPLQARLQSSGLLPIVTSTTQTPPVPIRLDIRMGKTELHVEGRGSDVLHLTNLDAEFRLAAESLADPGSLLGVTLPATGPFLMNGHVRKQDAVWSAAIAQFNVASSRLRGDFRYDPTKPVPELTGTLAGSRLALQDLAPAVGADADKKSGGADKTRTASKAGGDAKDRTRVLPERDFNIPSLAAMNANVEVKLASLDLGTPQLETFKPLNARIVLRDKVLRIQELVATASGGEMRGDLALDARQKTPRWNADLRWSGIQLSRFIKARNDGSDADSDETQKPDGDPGAFASGTTSARTPARPAARNARPAANRAAGDKPAPKGGTPYVTGVLSGAAKLQGAGRSTADLLASLEGTLQTWVREGKISHLLIELSGIDLAESLGLLLGDDDMLPMRCAVTQAVVRDGVLTPEVGVIDTRDTTVFVSGKVSFDDETLGLVLRAQPKDFSPLTLRSPVHIEGSFANPEIRLDRTAIGVRAAAAAALAVVTPLAGLLAFIDVGDEDKAACQDAVSALQGAGARDAAAAAKPPAGSGEKARER